MGGGSYPGIFSLFERDKSFGLWVYRDFAFEYPFMSGAYMQIVNFAAYLTPKNPDVTALFFSSLGIGFFLALCLILMWKMKVEPKKALIFFLLAPAVVFQLDLSFEMEQMFFFLIGIYAFQRGKEKLSAFSLALSAGTKLLPLATLPIFLQNTKKKLVFFVTYASTFLGGIGVEYAVSPSSFLRWMHFHESYGIEGSWLGFFFQNNVIDYSSRATYNIGFGTSLSFPPPYILISLSLLGMSLFFVYRSKSGLVEKCLLAFSCDVFFLWLTAPQFLINVIALFPLVLKGDVRFNRKWISLIAVFEGMNLFATPPIAAYIGIVSGFGWLTKVDTFWLALSSVYSILLAVLILRFMRKDIFGKEGRREN